MKTVKVKSAFPQQEDKGYKLAIFETHSAHADGQLYIADDKIHEVALTAGVKTAINENRLIEIGEDDQPENIDIEPADNEEEPYVDENDTAESLRSRYNTVKLQELAGKMNVTVGADWKKIEIAQEIVDAFKA